MKLRKIKEQVFWAGAIDWDRRLFDALIPLPDGTTYNAYLVVGSEKTALLDTVDPSMAEALMSQLEDVKTIDFIISQHAEQDHSGTIPHVLEKYGKAKVITSQKGKGFLVEHLHIPDDRIITIKDRETLSLGDKTLEFIYTPWVHWPETMVTYLHEDKILFTCDLFGSHFATSSLYADGDWRVCEAAKRYYAEVMMPFRANIRNHLDKLDRCDYTMIAPSHGPIHNKPECIVQSHKDWVSDKVANTVVLPYVSMHGSTQLMVDYLTNALAEKGIMVDRFNLTVADVGKLAMSLVDAATLILGSPTVLVGAHPAVVYAAFLANALKPKLKFVSIIGSYAWGGNMSKQITGLISNLKVEIIEPILIKGKPRRDDFDALDVLAETVSNKHRDGGIK